MGIEFGLGRFGDRRLEKGGPRSMRRWFGAPVHAFDVWLDAAPRRCGSRASCAMARSAPARW